jgi:pimeloyl-ACP methyl ester carboxylesterase
MSLRPDIADKYLEVEGLKIRYIETGVGRPLLLLHGMGFSLSADQWLPHIDAFSSFAHVYALDLPGWGLSDYTQAPYFPAWKRVVTGFCDQLGLDDFDIFGYSIGGWVTCQFAEDNAGRIRRIVLLDAPGLNLEAPSFIANFSPPSKEQLKNDMVLHMREIVTDAMVDAMYARLMRPGHVDAYKAVASYVSDPEVRKANALHPVLPKLQMPILFSQMDNAGSILIRYIFEAYTLAPNGRVFVYYGGTKRVVGGVVKVMEDTAIEFLTAAEVPPVARK